MSRFEGDGRAMLEALDEDIRQGTQPMKVRRAMCRTLVEQFDRRGTSHHSPRGAVLWVLVEHCRVSKIPFEVSSTLGGWVIEKLKGA